MRALVSTFAALTTSVSAFAHDAGLPHTHHADHVSWAPAVACAAAVGTVTWIAFRRRHAKARRIDRG